MNLTMLSGISDLCETMTQTGSQITNLISMAIKLIQLVIPILLIVWGMLDLGKAVVAQKDDEIKKGQKTFISRLTAAAIVFFIVTIVKLFVSLISGDSSNDIITCIDSILNGA